MFLATACRCVKWSRRDIHGNDKVDLAWENNKPSYCQSPPFVPDCHNHPDRIHGAAIYGAPWIPSTKTPVMLALIYGIFMVY